MLEYRVDDELSLRLLEPAHAEPLFELTHENRAYLREWLPWVDAVRRVDDTLEFIRTVQRRWADDNGYTLGMWYRDRLAGTVGHHFIDRANRATQIGYWVARPLQGRGIVTRATRTLVGFSLGTLRLHRVEIRCATGNVRSRHVPERLGFQQEGVVRDAEWLYDHFVDHQIYGMLDREWRG